MAPRAPSRSWLLGLLTVVACSGGGGGGDDGEPPCIPTGPERGGDSVDNDCNGLVDEVQVCASGGAEFATIGAAIAAAPDGTGIEVCAGVYAETLVIADRSVHLRGAGAETTVLDAGGVSSAVQVSGGHQVTIEGFTIRGGVTEDGGGGILCAGSGLELLDTAVVDNQAQRGGGLHATGCAVEVTGSLFEGNVATWTGGAVYLDGGTPAFRGCTIRNNSAAHEGGGFYLHKSPAVLEDNRVTGNTSEDDGGGLRLFESEARLERNTIANNRAGADGGGVKSSHLPSQFIDNTITDNECEGGGGGLELDNDSSVVRGGVISGNKAGRGGGIHVQLWPWNDGVIEDVRLVGNRAWRGGGIHVEDNFQPAVLRRLTIEGNTADQGGGLYGSGGFLVLSNAALAGNEAYDEGGGIFLTGSEPWNHDCPCPPVDPPNDIDFIVVHGNLAEEGGHALWTNAPNVSFESSIFSGHAGTAVTVAQGQAPAWRYNDTYPATFAGMADPTGSTGNLATEPQFAAAASGDFRLLAASACIDAGNPAFTDPDGSRADMGSHAGPGAP